MIFLVANSNIQVGVKFSKNDVSHFDFICM